MAAPIPTCSPSDERDEFIQQHLAFARMLARRFCRHLPRSADLEDLESDAYMGLIQSARRFKPNRGVLFRTYAARRILGAMLDGIRERHWPRRTTPPPLCQSLSTPIDVDDGACILLADAIADNAPPVGTALELHEEVEIALRQLDPLARRYLRDVTLGGLEQKQIARRDGISPARVSQRMKAIRKELAELRRLYGRAA